MANTYNTIGGELVEQKFLLAQQYIDQKIGPGINIAVRTNNVWQSLSLGIIDTNRSKTSPDIYYDIASVTKVKTALQILEQVSKGVISLDDPLSKYLPFLHPVEVTIQDCLMHRGRLILKDPYDKSKRYLRSDLRRIFESGDNINIETPHDYNYGDLGYMYLGMVLEEVLGDSLLHLVNEFFTRYCIPNITYNPVGKSIELSNIALSEKNSLPGAVQDEKASWYGGIAGHAGLFGTLTGLMEFVDALLEERFEIPGNYWNTLFLPQFDPSPRTGMSFSLAGFRIGLFSDKPNISGYAGSSIFINPSSKEAIVHTTNCTYPYRPQDRSTFKQWNKQVGQW